MGSLSARGQQDTVRRERSRFIQRDFGKYLIADLYAPITAVYYLAALAT